jgi:hypothetical protein
MVLTQVYLSEEEQQGLRALSQRTGRSQNELIREAINELLARHQSSERNTLLRQARGLWSKRTDLPNFVELCGELDRKYK